MSGFGFVFPGQGSQQPGMLSDLAIKFPIIQQVFEEASDALGKNLWAIAQKNPNNELNDTSITQPVLMAASVAIWRLWRSHREALIPLCCRAIALENILHWCALRL